MKPPRCIIIAGPNGAGKTTFAREYLPKDVSHADVLRRFDRGWKNFEGAYKSLADSWAVYDNSSEKLQLIERNR